MDLLVYRTCGSLIAMLIFSPYCSALIGSIGLIHWFWMLEFWIIKPVPGSSNLRRRCFLVLHHSSSSQTALAFHNSLPKGAQWTSTTLTNPKRVQGSSVTFIHPRCVQWSLRTPSQSGGVQWSSITSSNLKGVSQGVQWSSIAWTNPTGVQWSFRTPYHPERVQ